MSCPIEGTGKVKLLLDNNYILELENTRYVLELKRNLISLGELDEKYNINIHKGLISLTLGEKRVISCPKINEIYTVHAEPVLSQCTTTSNYEFNKSLLWHKRIGHISKQGLIILNKLRCFGKDNIEKLDFCENCLIGKQKRLPFKTGTHKSNPLLY